MTDELQEQIHEFLSEADTKEFWRAVEIYEEIIGEGSERLLELKSILEEGVDDGTYERLITTKKKERLVGYRIKGTDKATDTVEEATKRVDLSGWERKERI